ncbi:MAG: single-stranded DNA-binding protein [Treponemataceae bacterium]
MNGINSIIVEGNLVRKPELTKTPKGTPVCVFAIGSNRFYRGRAGEMQQETSFFDVETWAELAENCAKVGEKGAPVRVVGRIKQYRWKNKEGKNRYAVRIVAEHVEFKRRAQIEDEVDDMVEEEHHIDEAINHRIQDTEKAVIA